MPRCPKCERRLVVGAVCPTDKAVASAGPESIPAVAAAVPVLAGYVVGDVLGVGGYATVWRATYGQQAVALKVGNTAAEIGRGRFLREAQAMQRVGPPFAPKLVDHGHLPDGRPYIAMELLQGPTLASLLETAEGPPQLRWTCQVMEQLFAALERLAAVGVVHRDLKPENIFILSQPARLVVTDFGLTTRTMHEDASLTMAGAWVGTPAYMAPEQFSGAAVDAHCDMYAAGVIFYELLTLKLPFGAELAKAQHGHANLRPPNPSRFATVPESVSRFVLSCLAKDPSRRPSDGRVARQGLRDALDSITNAPVISANTDAVTLAARHQPVVLVALDVAAPAAEIERAVGAAGGFVARQSGQRTMLGFLGLASANPHEAALGLAQELVGRWSGRAALGLSSLRVRHRDGSMPKVFGSAVDKPETWLPKTWAGVVVAESLAQALQSSRVAALPDTPGFFTPVEARPAVSLEPTFVGRESVLEEVQRCFSFVWDTQTPAMFSLWSAPGLGKSRMAKEWVGSLGGILPAPQVVSLRATRGTAGSTWDTAHALASLIAPNPKDIPKGNPKAGEDPVQATRRLVKQIHEVVSRSPLAIVLDDAHLADDVTLDALELATATHERLPLFVFLTADRALLETRPDWGRRATRHTEATLQPLSAEAGHRLAAQLLLPAEFPPSAILERLHEWSGGSPAQLTELVAGLKRANMVRKRDDADSWYVATVEFERLPATPAAQWLAVRELQTMPPEYAAHAQLCAVLGENFDADETSFVQDGLEREGKASTPVDAEVGLRELARRGIYNAVGSGRYAFAQSALRGAVYNLVGDEERKAIHGHAFRYWHQRLEAGDTSRATLEAVARHGAASDQRAVAAQASIALGDRARAEHRAVLADNYYTAALELLPLTEVASRMAALAGRGRARYQFSRIAESLADLRAGEALADATGDRERMFDFLSEQATAHDWGWDFKTSSEIVERLEQLFASPLDHQRARLFCAQGRSAMRHQRWVEAVPLLEAAIEVAAARHEVETQVIALSLLAYCLNHMNRPEETERTYEKVVALCESSGDRLHLAVAYNNRIMYWAYRGQLLRGIDDAKKALGLSRELGNPMSERTATYNLAEMLLWAGDEVEAEALARRGKQLQERFFGPAYEEAVLLGRILAVRGEFSAAHDEIVATFKGKKPERGASEIAEMFALVIKRLAEDGAGAPIEDVFWLDTLALAKRVAPGAEYAELLHQKACWELRRADTARLGATVGELEKNNTSGVLAARISKLREGLQPR